MWHLQPQDYTPGMPDSVSPGAVAAVVVTFHPRPEAAAGIEAALAQAQRVIVIDNGSAESELAPLAAIRDERLEILRNAGNLGVAAAQNRGIKRARELGAAFVLLLDQDSVAEPGMVAALRAACTDPSVGIAAALAADTSQKKAPQFLTSADGRLCEIREATEPVTHHLFFAIASGSLIPVATFDRAGLMREDYFIDDVDIEFGLRVRRAGLDIVAVRDARLRHRLGEYEERRFMGRTIPVTHHSAQRRFYQARNRRWTKRLHGSAFPGYFRSRHRAARVDLLRLLLFERGRIGKLWATFRGALAGMFGTIR